jgi:photosystem II stability/assembly factor-like uncharacterized protein
MKLWQMIKTMRILFPIMLLCFFSSCTTVGEKGISIFNSRHAPILANDNENPNFGRRFVQIPISQMISPKCWFSAGDTTLWKSTDSGLTWTASYPHSRIMNIKAAIGGVSFLNEQVGFLIDGQKLFKTTDGGANWYKVGMIKVGDENCLLDNCYDFKACFFQNQMRGWAVGQIWTKDYLIKHTEVAYEGVILKTEDGGLTWKRQHLELPAKHVNKRMRWSLRDISFISEKAGWIAGDNAIFRTVDGGQSWHIGNFKGRDFEGYCVRVQFLNEQFGWVLTGDLGTKEFLITKDGGQTWEVLEGVESSAHGMPVNVIFTSPPKGLLFEEQLYATKDGGKNWHKITPGACGDNPCFIERTRYGAIVAFCTENNQEKPFISTDNGKTWKSP